MKKILLIIVSIFLLSGCSSTKNPIVTMEIENYGEVKIELYPNMAPNTVANFVNLIEEGFYDGLTFHRLAPGFVLQGGDPNGDGTGGPGYSIKGEFKNNNFTSNTLSHTTGVISMARAYQNDTAGSQFFIVLSDTAKYSLDDSYAGFGMVIEGMDIIKKIEANETTTDELLDNKVTMTKVTVDTFGKNYEVKKIAEK